MTTDRAIEIALALIAMAGGGGVWAWLTSKKKTHAEADEIATKSAMGAMLQSLEFLKSRVAALDSENANLRLQIEVEREQLEARHQQELASALEKMNYFQKELGETRAAMQVMQSEFTNCKINLEEQIRITERKAAKLEDFMRRFPQFAEGFTGR